MLFFVKHLLCQWELVAGVRRQNLPKVRRQICKSRVNISLKIIVLLWIQRLFAIKYDLFFLFDSVSSVSNVQHLGRAKETRITPWIAQKILFQNICQIRFGRKMGWLRNLDTVSILACIRLHESYTTHMLLFLVTCKSNEFNFTPQNFP